MDLTSWQLPLLLAPIVGLLLISTSTRHAQIHAEIHQLLSGDHNISRRTIERLRFRVRLFRNALVALYGSAAMLAVGSLSALVVSWSGANSTWVIVIFAALAIGAFIYGLAQLIRESYQSLEIFNAHIDDILERR